MISKFIKGAVLAGAVTAGVAVSSSGALAAAPATHGAAAHAQARSTVVIVCVYNTPRFGCQYPSYLPSYGGQYYYGGNYYFDDEYCGGLSFGEDWDDGPRFGHRRWWGGRHHRDWWDRDGDRRHGRHHGRHHGRNRGDDDDDDGGTRGIVRMR